MGPPYRSDSMRSLAERRIACVAAGRSAASSSRRASRASRIIIASACSTRIRSSSGLDKRVLIQAMLSEFCSADRLEIVRYSWVQKPTGGERKEVQRFKGSRVQGAEKNSFGRLSFPLLARFNAQAECVKHTGQLTDFGENRFDHGSGSVTEIVRHHDQILGFRERSFSNV